jgi:hypothetical protein
MPTDKEKEQLSKRLLKAQRDHHFKRIDNVKLQNEVAAITKEANGFANFSANSVLSYLTEHESRLEKELEKEHQQQYSTLRPIVPEKKPIK